MIFRKRFKTGIRRNTVLHRISDIHSRIGESRNRVGGSRNRIGDGDGRCNRVVDGSGSGPIDGERKQEDKSGTRAQRWREDGRHVDASDAKLRMRRAADAGRIDLLRLWRRRQTKRRLGIY